MPFLRPSGHSTAPDVIRHIEHALQIAGEDHVGIGTDGAVPAVVHLNEYRESQKSVFEERRKLGIAAPGESPDVMLLVPEYNSPRRLERLADDFAGARPLDRPGRKDIGWELCTAVPRGWT